MHEDYRDWIATVGVSNHMINDISLIIVLSAKHISLEKSNEKSSVHRYLS